MINITLITIKMKPNSGGIRSNNVNATDIKNKSSAKVVNELLNGYFIVPLLLFVVFS